jgi:hypothetical protein
MERLSKGETMTEVERELQKIEANARLYDSATHDAEVRRILDEELHAAGLKPKQSQVDPAVRQHCLEVGSLFMQRKPSYNPTAANEAIIHDFLQREGMSYTLHNLEIAYASVRDQLSEKPSEKRTRTVQAASVIDGLKITRANIEALSAREMERRMQNPRFVEAVNALN